MDIQKVICRKYNVPFYASPNQLKIGVSINVKDKQLFPIHGLRLHPENDTTGWYIWVGEVFSEKADFFIPLHVEHLREWRPEILSFLGLPPGYRFLIGENGYEDVWFDETLINSPSSI